MECIHLKADPTYHRCHSNFAGSRPPQPYRFRSEEAAAPTDLPAVYYIEPRTEVGRAPDPAFWVVWLNKADRERNCCLTIHTAMEHSSEIIKASDAAQVLTLIHN
jgi:hypothetical protein